MASGSYFPKAARGIEIPKRNEKVRLLGILTIENKIIAQMVVRDRSEVKIQGIFLVDSYEYIHGR
ncbi:hypothetical protein [Clostridium botulinum]|uniref:hypothetical protein n=1 Tax=Clostridium botulinum TaxID=1491 RepID=UPI000A6602FC|nr:hypothetical protein [Clostridium botulinum]MCR1146667.1 hypothetical protein [Clostridium botulinum]